MEENEEIQGDLGKASKENQPSTRNETNEVDNDVEKNPETTENNEAQPENEQKDEAATVKKSQKLFFCNINRSSDLSNIFKVFRNYGKICDILILKDKNGHSLGRGFVEFMDESDAENALNCLNNTFVDGLKISINFATPRVRKASDVEYKQDPEKLDEDMRRKDIRLRIKKNEALSRMPPPQQARNSHRKRRSYRDSYGDYSRSQDQYDYMSDYDPYGYDIDDREFNDRRIRRERDRERDRRYHHEISRDRERNYIREFDRDRDQDYYVSPHSHHHGRPPPPVAYIQESSRHVVPNIPVMRGPYRPDLLPPNSARVQPPHGRSRRPNNDYDFDYDYDHDHHNHRRRVESLVPQQRHPNFVRSTMHMLPYSQSRVVYQPVVGRSNSSPAGSNAAESPTAATTVIRVVPGQQQIGQPVVPVRQYPDDIRMQRGQPPPNSLPDEQQRGYWDDNDYDQRNYRRRDRI